jgi:hypothetical protein
MAPHEHLQKIFDYKNGQLIRKVDSARLAKAGSFAGFLDEKSGYYRVGVKGKTYLVHRVIFFLHHGFLPEFLDHINGIRTDNRIENLRVATKQQNCQNRAKHRNNSSGLKNVSWHKERKKWGVSIHVHERKRHFGYFEDLELADLVSQEARDKYHGQFARNF